MGEEHLSGLSPGAHMQVLRMGTRAFDLRMIDTGLIEFSIRPEPHSLRTWLSNYDRDTYQQSKRLPAEWSRSKNITD